MSAPVTYEVRHDTSYVYGMPVVHAHHLLHLTPRQSEYQQVGWHRIDIDPKVAPVADVDAFGNAVTRLEVDHPHERLRVAAAMTVTVLPRPPYAAAESLPWERLRDELNYVGRPRTPREIEAACFRVESPHARIKNAFSDLAAECFARGRPVLACAEALMHKLHREFTYAPGTTEVGTPLLAVLETRRGVCQDFAHLMIACLRSHGLAARYVSGYLRTVPVSDAKPLTGADASHAWVAVYAPPFGWVDLDPTNGIRVGTDHVTLAWGRDFSDVSPIRGVIVGGGAHTVTVGVRVAPTKQSQNA